MRSKKDITIVVCSNRPEKIEKYINSSILNSIDYSFLIILDASVFRNIDPVTSTVVIVKSKVSGLSQLRNQALREVNTKYILFLDDDVSFTSLDLDSIYNGLASGSDIVGAKLTFPESFNQKWYLTQNQYHYIAIHAHKIDSIWGACMGYKMSFIKKSNTWFNENLDRKGSKLLSGGDTTFIRSLIKLGASTLFLKDISIIHNVDSKRISFQGMVKRVFWQGITEVIRKNIYNGIKKEFYRNIKSSTRFDLCISVFWFIVFLIGIGYGFLFKSKV